MSSEFRVQICRIICEGVCSACRVRCRSQRNESAKGGTPIRDNKREGGKRESGGGEGRRIDHHENNVLWRGGEKERRDIGELKQASFIGTFASNLKRSYLFSVLN